MPLNIYLFFNGNCREAFEFYKSVFGGEYSDFNTFADGPPDMEVPEAAKDDVMHVSLPVGERVLMGSDSGPEGPPVTVGNNYSISFSGDDRAHCDRIFAALAEGGTVLMPLQETFWGAYFGTLADKFGIQWMVDCALQEG